jgi:two-component system sensor histidine kinase UhpB
VALLGTALLLRQGSADVQREMRAAEAIIEYLQVAARRDPASLHGGLAANLRHVRVTRVPAEGVAPPVAESALQQWLAAHLLPDAGPALQLQLDDGQPLQIALDPADEIEEVWDSLLQLLLLSLLAWLVSLLSIAWAVRRGLRVLDELLAGLARVSQGPLDVRLAAHSMPEARSLAGRFNVMATTLQQVQADNAELT